MLCVGKMKVQIYVAKDYCKSKRHKENVSKKVKPKLRWGLKFHVPSGHFFICRDCLQMSIEETHNTEKIEENLMEQRQNEVKSKPSGK